MRIKPINTGYAFSWTAEMSACLCERNFVCATRVVYQQRSRCLKKVTHTRLWLQRVKPAVSFVHTPNFAEGWAIRIQPTHSISDRVRTSMPIYTHYSPQRHFLHVPDALSVLMFLGEHSL